MSMAVAGSVAASLLCLGGFGAVVYGAGPGDALYGLRTALFGEQQQTRDRSGGAGLAAAGRGTAADRRGPVDAAQDKLQTLTTTVATVNDVEQKQELVTQWQDLTVKVDAKDPNATLPPRRSAAGDARAGRRCAGLDHVDNHVVGDEQLDVVIVGARRRPLPRRAHRPRRRRRPPRARRHRARRLLKPPPPVGTPTTDHDADDDHDHRHDDDNDDPAVTTDQHTQAAPAPPLGRPRRRCRVGGGRPPLRSTPPAGGDGGSPVVAVPKSSRPRRQSRQR